MYFFEWLLQKNRELEFTLLINNNNTNYHYQKFYNLSWFFSVFHQIKVSLAGYRVASFINILIIG